MSLRRVTVVVLVAVLVLLVGWQRLVEHDPAPGLPFTSEAAYGPVEWSGDVMVINHAQSNWREFQRIALEPDGGTVRIRILLTQVDHLSVGDPTYVWRSQTLHMPPNQTSNVYVGEALARHT